MNRSPARFLILTFCLALPFWIAGSLVPTGGVLPFGLPVSMFQFVCPLLAATYLTFRYEGRAAVTRLLRDTWSLRRLRWRGLWPVLLVPASGLVNYAMLPLADIPRTGPHTPLPTAAVLLVTSILTASAEEAGWTGYATRALRARWGTVGAGLIIGVAWAIFHVPALLQAHRPVLWIVGWALGTIAGRVLIVSVFANTGCAVIVAVVMHDLMIVTSTLTPHFDVQPRSAVALISGLALTAAAAVYGVAAPTPPPRSPPEAIPTSRRAGSC